MIWPSPMSITLGFPVRFTASSLQRSVVADIQYAMGIIHPQLGTYQAKLAADSCCLGPFLSQQWSTKLFCTHARRPTTTYTLQTLLTLKSSMHAGTFAQSSFNRVQVLWQGCVVWLFAYCLHALHSPIADMLLSKQVSCEIELEDGFFFVHVL